VAAQYGHNDLVNLLLARDDINADSKDMYGQIPLLFAALNGCTEVVELLLARQDVNVNSKGRQGQTRGWWNRNPEPRVGGGGVLPEAEKNILTYT
jgi:ankyrin repeat protein